MSLNPSLIRVLTLAGVYSKISSSMGAVKPALERYDQFRSRLGEMLQNSECEERTPMYKLSMISYQLSKLLRFPSCVTLSIGTVLQRCLIDGFPIPQLFRLHATNS
jgi:hypothetical protein